MVADYLARSLTFFRDAKSQCDVLLQFCRQNGWKKIALVGQGDLADIVSLVAQSNDLKVFVVTPEDHLSVYDAVLVTDVINPQGTYESIKHKVDPKRLLTLDLLHISKGPTHLKGAE